jgi:hypothetical protein
MWSSPKALAEATARQLALQYDDLADVRPTVGAERLLRVLEVPSLPWAVVTSTATCAAPISASSPISSTRADRPLPVIGPATVPPTARRRVPQLGLTVVDQGLGEGDVMHCSLLGLRSGLRFKLSS